ncbi:Panacea domain-containing protein [Clostridium sp. Mt-5]|uniref:Panacea domain-containing protein n=1 Tax=Clostridium moutaii TaxID=3240932 RepID=A0ABV4BUR2_9CLOT
MIYNALDVARYVINYSNHINSPISNLQLQKIMYYIQAAFLVEKDQRCFHEEILNWTYGPVVDKVYREFRTFGYSPIPKQEEYINIGYHKESSRIKIEKKKFDENIFCNSDKKLIQQIVDIYSNMEPFDLVNKTHSEDPWRKTKQNDVISIEDIKSYYTDNINKLYGQGEN